MITPKTIRKHYAVFAFLCASLFLLSSCAVEGPDPGHKPMWKHPLSDNPSPGMILQTRPPKRLESSDAYDLLSEANVVLAGEQHSHPGSHQVQFEILEQLHQQYGSIGVGFELFREPQQELLSAWAGNAINFNTLKEQLNLSESGEKLLASYQLILRYARNKNLPLRALKPSRKAVDEVRNGTRNVSNDPGSSSPMDSQQRKFLRAQFKEHVPTGRGFESFLKVQRFWEEQMASNIDTLLSDPETPSRILVLTGNYHVAHDFALPAKIRQKGSWTVRSLITIPVNRNLREVLDFTGNNPETSSMIADLIWWVEPEW